MMLDSKEVIWTESMAECEGNSEGVRIICIAHEELTAVPPCAAAGASEAGRSERASWARSKSTSAS
jgi:hypothetical protein